MQATEIRITVTKNPLNEHPAREASREVRNFNQEHVDILSKITTLNR